MDEDLGKTDYVCCASKARPKARFPNPIRSMHVAAYKLNQADHGKKRDPRNDEIKEIIKMELDKHARLKKRTLRLQSIESALIERTHDNSAGLFH